MSEEEAGVDEVEAVAVPLVGLRRIAEAVVDVVNAGRFGLLSGNGELGLVDVQSEIFRGRLPSSSSPSTG